MEEQSEQADYMAQPVTMIDGNDIESLKNLFGSSIRSSKVSSLPLSRSSRTFQEPGSSIGEGSNIKHWLSTNIDFSVANASKISNSLRPGTTPLMSKIASANEAKRSKKLSKKKELTDTAKADILNQLDLKNEQNAQLKSTKLGRSLQDARKEQERLKQRFNANQGTHL